MEYFGDTNLRPFQPLKKNGEVPETSNTAGSTNRDHIISFPGHNEPAEQEISENKRIRELERELREIGTTFENLDADPLEVAWRVIGTNDTLAKEYIKLVSKSTS